jgi:hypothetical protein
LASALTFLSADAFAIDDTIEAFEGLVAEPATIQRDGSAVDVSFGEGGDVATLRADMVDASDVPSVFGSLLQGAVQSALRIEITSNGLTPASVDSEAFAMALLADLTAVHGGIVWDDLGFAYDPAEVELLGHLGGTRHDTFVYTSALTPDVTDEQAHAENQTAPAPAASGHPLLPDPLPDVAVGSGKAFAFYGPHLPIVGAARALAAAPAFVIAPATPHDELALLAPLVYEVPSETATAPPEVTRREVLLFSPLPIGAQRTLEVTAGFAAERRATANFSGAEEPDVALASRADVDAADPRFPACVASFSCGSAELRVYAFPLAHAHRQLASLVALWRRPVAVLGNPVRSVVILESVSRGDSEQRDALRLDVLATGLAYRLARSAAAVVALDSGGLISIEELAHLLAGARGIYGSWTAWNGAYLPRSLSAAVGKGDRT